VLLDGRRIDRRSPHWIARAGLVRTFQTPRALTRMTVLDNMLVGGNRPQRAHELLELVRLGGYADALAGTLSGGQRKLLDLVRALMAEPRVLLLDEPTQGLSVEETAQAVDTLARFLQASRMTVLLVEHDMEVVFRLADRITVLHRGAVIADGVPDQVKTDPRVQDAYLGGFA
jgi:branched-chain amino acid transport system ATP-binding protein